MLPNPVYMRLFFGATSRKMYFAGSDVAKALGYAIPHKAVQTHCKGVLKWNIPTNSGNQDVLFITEGDIYRLIMKSKLPSADKFESWVMDEVLPSIRKTGSYNKPITTARKLYAFLELAQGQFSRWVKANIVDNEFVTENEDYFYSPSMANESSRGNFADDYKLTAHFAKNRWNSKKGI